MEFLNSPVSQRAHYYGHAEPAPPAPPLPPPPLTLSYAPLLVSARREGGGSWKGKGGRKGEKDCERGGVGSELLERTNESVVKVRQQCEVEESERPSAIID